MTPQLGFSGVHGISKFEPLQGAYVTVACETTSSNVYVDII